MSAFQLFGKIVLAGMEVAAQQNHARCVKSAEDQYWDGRLDIVLESIEQLRCIPIRQFGGAFPDVRRQEREVQEREQKCNELRNKAKRAQLEKSKWDMDRIERDIKSAVFFAS